MLELLNGENFCKYSDESITDYNEFTSIMKELGLDLNCFFVDDGIYVINRIWYIEGYVTVPLPIISKEMISMFRLGEVVEYRRELNKELEEERDFVSIFTLIEKCFRMSYFLDIYEELNNKEFLKLYEYVYSTCEYNFEYILNDDILLRLKEAKNLNDIKTRLKEGR